MHGTIGMTRRTVDTAPVPASFPKGERWYVVRTNIRCEDRAQMGLVAAGFRAFLPQITKWQKHARVSKVGKVALFPRYLFVEADFNRQSITDIHQTHGVESIINNNGVPTSIYGEFILKLLERQLRGQFDQTRDDTGQQTYPVGARIVIAEGKWEDAIGIIERFKGGQRAEILVSIMGRKQRQTLELANMRPKW